MAAALTCIWCVAQEAGDQVRAIDFVKETKKYSDMVDWTKQTGIYGHSMGGAATSYNSADADRIAKYNIGAAVHLHTNGAPGVKGALVPSFFASGSADTIAPARSVKKLYEMATKEKIFAEITGASHFECQSFEPPFMFPKHRWTPYVTSWFDCHLKKLDASCTAAKNVCNDLPMTECEAANADTTAPAEIAEKSVPYPA